MLSSAVPQKVIFLPVQLIYKETKRRCHPKHKFPAGWDITHSKKHREHHDPVRTKRHSTSDSSR